MVNFDKFLASFINEMKKHQPITSYNLPGCIKKALKDQGLEYKDGEIVKISAESEDERIRKSLIDGFKRYDDGALFNGCSVREILLWLEKQGNPNKEYWKGYKDGVKKILDKYSETHKVIEPKFKIGDIISNGKVEYRIDGITKNCLGQDSYFLVNIEDEEKGLRKLIVTDSEGKHHYFGETEWLCEQVDRQFKKKELKNEQKSTWSEEDDLMLECVLDKIGDLGTGVMCKGWLKSLKNRIKEE